MSEATCPQSFDEVEKPGRWLAIGCANAVRHHENLGGAKHHIGKAPLEASARVSTAHDMILIPIYRLRQSIDLRVIIGIQSLIIFEGSYWSAPTETDRHYIQRPTFKAARQ